MSVAAAMSLEDKLAIMKEFKSTKGLMFLERNMDPTARGDMEASVLRVWYEANREGFWARYKPGIVGAGPDRTGEHADNFMLGFIAEVHRVQALSDKQLVDEEINGRLRR